MKQTDWYIFSDHFKTKSAILQDTGSHGCTIMGTFRILKWKKVHSIHVLELNFFPFVNIPCIDISVLKERYNTNMSTIWKESCDGFLFFFHVTLNQQTFYLTHWFDIVSELTESLNVARWIDFFKYIISTH